MVDSQKLIDSSQHLDDSSHLASVLEENGYLFFRGLLNLELLDQVKTDILSILREHHIIENVDSSEPLWSGGPHPNEEEYLAFYDRIVRLDSFIQLAESPEITGTLASILGNPVDSWTQKLIRIIYPTPETPDVPGTGAHQDGAVKLGYDADVFYTGWLPLMEITHEVGGLALVPGSHRKGLRELAGLAASSLKETNKQGAGALHLDVAESDWATTEYLPGDIVLFSNLMVHRGTTNRSNRIRLSCDFRYQPSGNRVSWLASALGPEVRRFAQKLDRLMASRALFVTTRATPVLLEEVRTQMLIEKNATLERAQEIIAELQNRET